jgi:hypothetical protein
VRWATPHAARVAGPDPPEQEIASVTADGAFGTRKRHDAIAARGATAIIPARKTAKPWKPVRAGLRSSERRVPGHRSPSSTASPRSAHPSQRPQRQVRPGSGEP